MAHEEEPLSEPYPVSDQYVDGLAKIESTGTNVRFVLTTNRERDDGVDREVVARIVMPLEALKPAILKLLQMKAIDYADLADLFVHVTRDRGQDIILQ